MPTYQDLVNALCDIMDGMQDHDIQSATGLPDEDCDFIADVRRAVLSSWDVNGPRNYRYQGEEDF
jgi:hypothetical protein